jgi:hypothetical protein
MNSIESIKLASYQPRSFREIEKGEWVNYGEDNLFPQYLVDLFHQSPTHNALCTTIAMMIYGEGFDPADLNAKLLFAQWGLEDELRKVALDLKIHNGFALEIVWSLDRTTIATVKHLAFECVRSGTMDENEVVHEYYYSRNWSDRRHEPVCLPKFSPESKNEEPTQILYVKPFTVGAFYYPKPDYLGALNYIELEKEIGVFHINNIKNGLSPSFAIHFKNGIPSDEERQKIRMDIERQGAGAQNAGKFWMTFSDEPDRVPEIEAFALSDADKQYQFLSEETTAKIMVGHRVTNPMMFGVATPGKLGGGTEIAESATLFDEQVVFPARQVIIEACETLLNACGVPSQVNPKGVEVGEADVTQSYTGIQVSSALEIIGKQVTGELTTSQAIQLLVTMLGFPLASAQRMFEEVALSKQADLNAAFEWLESRGEVMGEEWELIDEQEVDYELEDAQDALWSFARTLRNYPSRKSSQDNEIVRVRYAYAPTQLADDKSRDFCSRMIGAMKVYRKEDIISAGNQSVNPGWGPNGADTYSIWLYKGGGSCRHFWMRQTYLQKDNKLVSVNEAKALIQSLPVSERAKNRLEENDPLVAKRPRDMANRGFLEKKNFTTPR